MSDRLRALAHVFTEPSGLRAAHEDEVIEVSAPVSTAAVVYERIRNTLEYQEEHLLRRNAILRFFHRHLGDEGNLADTAEDLLRELVWAQYLPNKTVPLHLADTLRGVTLKYDVLLKTAERSGDEREYLTRWILDALATDVEQTIAPPRHDEGLVSVMYEEMRGRVLWDAAFSLSEEERDLRVFLAAHRALLKSNQSTLRLRVLTLYYPDWAGESTKPRVDELAANLRTIARMVDADITHPLTERLTRLFRRRAGILRVLRDVIARDPERFPSLVTDPDALDHAVVAALRDRTVQFRMRLRRTVVRAVLFLFFTKMLLALLLEVPYDLLLSRETPLYPLLVNIFFPPFFLALLSLTVRVPEKRNEEDYIAAVRALVVGAEHPALNLRLRHETPTIWTTTFNVVYTILFVGVFGVIGVALHRMGFHALSIALFLFFLSLVTFFGIRIRSSVKDIVALESRSGIVGTAFDVFMLPIVKAGSWLTVKVAKINVFIFFFDFMIEAPFKVAIRVAERWFAFIREKKEEI